MFLADMKKIIPKSRLEQLYWDEGKSIYKISEELNIPKTTVQKWLKVRGVPTRSHWESLTNHVTLKDDGPYLPFLNI